MCNFPNSWCYVPRQGEINLFGDYRSKLKCTVYYTTKKVQGRCRPNSAKTAVGLRKFSLNRTKDDRSLPSIEH